MLAFSSAACGAGRLVPRNSTRLSPRPPNRAITAKSSSIPGEPLPPSIQPKVSSISRRADSTALAGKSAKPVRLTCQARGQAASSVMVFSHGFRCSDITVCRGPSQVRRSRFGGKPAVIRNLTRMASHGETARPPPAECRPKGRRAERGAWSMEGRTTCSDFFTPPVRVRLRRTSRWKRLARRTRRFWSIFALRANGAPNTSR